MDAGKLDFLTFTAKDTGVQTSFGVPHSEIEWERADLGDGWIRFVSGGKEFKFHPESLEARYRDNNQNWTLSDTIAAVREEERQRSEHVNEDSRGLRATAIGPTEIWLEWEPVRLSYLDY